MKISFIMASYLGHYPNAAKEREAKFIRAVDSFLQQDNKNCELIIVADGCDITERLVRDFYLKYESIEFIKIPKCKHTWSGEPRNTGINLATGELIAYLDTDDYIDNRYVDIMLKNYDPEFRWYYFNDLIYNKAFERFVERVVMLQANRCGTSNIVHERSLNVFWRDTTYLHDWRFIQELLRTRVKYKYIGCTGYYVCHLPKRLDV